MTSETAEMEASVFDRRTRERMAEPDRHAAHRVFDKVRHVTVSCADVLSQASSSLRLSYR